MRVPSFLMLPAARCCHHRLPVWALMPGLDSAFAWSSVPSTAASASASYDLPFAIGQMVF